MADFLQKISEAEERARVLEEQLADPGLASKPSEYQRLGKQLAVEKPVHPNDLHATLLHQFGLDHLKLTHRFNGRDFRLTDVAGNVIDDWLA